MFVRVFRLDAPADGCTSPGPVNQIEVVHMVDPTIVRPICDEADDDCRDRPVFALGKCRRHYERDRQARKNAGEVLASGPTPRRPNELECAGCGGIFRAEQRRVEAAAAGKAVYHSRECQKVHAQVEIACACNCGRTTKRYRSQGFDKNSRVFFEKACAEGLGYKPRAGDEAPCGYCGKPVYRSPSEAAKAEVRFCDSVCFGKSLEGERVERPEVPCEVCGEIMRLEPDQANKGVRMHAKCAAIAKRRKTRYVDPGTGYAMVTTPDGRSMLEHRWVMEQHLGRVLLAEETVHHKTGGFAGRSNNALSNLELWSGKHPSGHRVEDIVSYCREMLAVYGTAAERELYAGVVPSAERAERL